MLSLAGGKGSGARRPEAVGASRVAIFRYLRSMARRALRQAWYLLLLGFLPGMAWGQGDRPMLRVGFDRQNDFTFSANLDAWYKWEKGRYSLDFRLLHSNVYNNSRDDARFVQLYFHSDIWQHYAVKPKLDLASWIETDQYVSNQNEKLNLYAGVRYKPFPFLKVTPLVGYSWDTRTAILGRSEPTVRLDQGVSPALFVTSEHDFGDNLAMRTQLRARYKAISPRRQANFEFTHGWTKAFEEGVTLDAGLRATTHELDDYQANSVKRILSDTISPHLDLGYTFGPGLAWRSENNLLLHRRRFLFENLVGPDPEENDLTFQGIEIRTYQWLGWVRPRMRANASYEFQYLTRSYDLANSMELNASDYELAQERERQKDFLKNQHKLEANVVLPMGRRQSLELAVANQYLQYDTPSESNFDDRDELSWSGVGKWVGQWNKALQTSLELQGNYRHYAFLFSEKSQDNYIQRSLRMDYGFKWMPGKAWRLEGQQSIYVTYNVKDFEDFNKTDRSTRNLESNFKATWRPSESLQGELGFRRKETHQSYLDWERFAETTLDTNRILTIENRWRYNIMRESGQRLWYVEAGYKHFDQTRRFKTNMVGIDNLLKAISLRQINLQTGPLAAVGLRDRRRQSTVDLGLWLQVQVQRHRYEVLATTQIFGAAQQESQLQAVTVAVRPYPTVRVNYFWGGRAAR